jgi:sugar fermentation stimulation protein A
VNPPKLHVFTRPEPATFLERPNRFVMRVRDARGRTLRAHCPNPGRLLEFLVPGQPLLIERPSETARPGGTGRPGRGTEATVVAVQHHGKTIFLYASKANDIAGSLILPKLFPEHAIIPEWTVRRSRFDFLVRAREQLRGTPTEQDRLVEVKSCSLMEYGLAMFPDAPTLRGSRHVDELVELTTGKFRGDYQGEILFILAHEDARRFMPNPHTDPAFCLALHRASGILPIRAVSVAAQPDGTVLPAGWDIPVETELPARLAEANRGVYLLVLRVEEPVEIPVPRIGSPVLEPGWYVYAGSAKANLEQRLARHLRKRKKLHWHIDHLSRAAASVRAFPVRTFHDLECPLAQDIARHADGEVPGFGSSDCSCSSHLFFFHDNPLQRREVLNTLFFYRHVRAFEG